MKKWKWILAVAILAMPLLTIGQCANPANLTALDVTFTGSGNSTHTFTFPKFDASMGSLVGVTIRAEVTLRYRFELENRENITISNYRVRVVREDEISGSALWTPITNNHQANYGPYSLAADDGVAGSGNDFISAGPMYVMNDNVVQQTVYNTTDFLGQGNVSLDYSANTYSIVFGSVNYNFNGTAEDTVRFTVTYSYCANSALPATLADFNATKNRDNSVSLRWLNLTEVTGSKYDIERSTDGRNFSSVGQLMASNGKYQFLYHPQGSDNGNIVFRIKVTEPDGTITYSALRVVDLRRNVGGIKIYPNPSNGNFNVMFSNTKRDDWQVSIINLNGQVLKQFEFKNSLMERIQLQNLLSKGQYLLRSVNKRSGQAYSQPLIID